MSESNSRDFVSSPGFTDGEYSEVFKMGESFGFDAGYEAGQAATPEPIRTLRDEFAMAALTGMVACSKIIARPETLVNAAWRYADLMIAGREAQS